MKKYGLIGKSLAHSWSPAWFADKFEREGITDAEYRLYEMDTVEHLRQWVEENGIDGFNVTIPFKEQVLPFLDRVDDVARRVGAVNCVEVRQGVLVGHNTDAPAFAETLSPLLRPWHTQPSSSALGALRGRCPMCWRGWASTSCSCRAIRLAATA